MNANQPVSDAELAKDTFVKKSGDTDWVPTDHPKAQKIMQPISPDQTLVNPSR